MKTKDLSKYIVFKTEDLIDVFEVFPETKDQFNNLADKYNKYRKLCGKKPNSYIVVNQDEKYADAVWDLILK